MFLKNIANLSYQMFNLTNNRPQNIDNFECYLEYCFAGWKEKFANTPEKMIEDMKHFAEMEV